jgi:WS/DGAT/MGAT family acyltransferase
MSPEDAAFLYFEKPDAPLHIGSLHTFEGVIDFDRAYRSFDARMHLIPRYRQLAMIPPFYAGHPTWEDDPNFSLDRHFRQVDLPAPGTDEQLREFASDLFAPPLPRDRPLWDMVLINGLQGNRTAMVTRVHHCLVDGVSGVELLLVLLDLVPDPEPTPEPEEPWQPNPRPDPLRLWADAMFEEWDRGLKQFAEFQESLLNPRAQMRRMTDLAHAFEVALPAMRQPAKAPWNKPVTAKRRVATSEMSFQEVRRIRSALGGTVNDVMLTLLGGALGRYMDHIGEKTAGRTVRMMIPVNVRAEDEKGALGNRVSMMLPNIPAGIADSVARLQAVRDEMQHLKDQSQANAFEAFVQLSQNVPAAFHALAGINGVPPGGANLVCTNVPGPMIPLWSVGHRMLSMHPMLPLAGDLGLGVGIMSFNQSLYFGIMSDPNIVADVDMIARFLDEEFVALKKAAGVEASDTPTIGARPRSTNGNGHGSDAPVPEQLAKPQTQSAAAPVSAG